MQDRRQTDQLILQQLRESNEAQREGFKELRLATSELTASVSELGKVVASVEATHAAQHSDINRIHDQVDDLETRVRTLEMDETLEDRVTSLEKDRSFLAGGWRFAVVIGTVLSAIVSGVMYLLKDF